MGSGQILIVDDDDRQRTLLKASLESLGYEVSSADSGERAMESLRYGNVDVLVTDLQMPGMDGIRLIERVQSVNPTVSVIMITGHGSIETAIRAIKAGAEDYLLKPVELDNLEVVLKRLFEKRNLVRENRLLKNENEVLKRELKIRYHVTAMIGKSAATKLVIKRVEEVIKNRQPVLILGEPGTGRAELARMIHYNSPWGDNSFIEFDCAQVPQDFHETHLFGEELSIEGGVKTPSRPGLVERAHLGTLALCNFHLLGKKCQSQLSKVMRNRQVNRTGGTKFYPVDTRIIATSNLPDFEKAKNESTLRWDIHDFLLENVIELPSLAERAEDIPILIAATAKRVGVTYGKNIEKIHPEVVSRLVALEYPGNYRELAAMVEAAVIRCGYDESELKPEHLSLPKS